MPESTVQTRAWKTHGRRSMPAGRDLVYLTRCPRLHLTPTSSCVGSPPIFPQASKTRLHFPQFSPSACGLAHRLVSFAVTLVGGAKLD
jgi:hypothetical protein